MYERARPAQPRICAAHVARTGVDGGQTAIGTTEAASDCPVVASMMLAGASAYAALIAGESAPATISRAQPSSQAKGGGRRLRQPDEDGRGR